MKTASGKLFRNNLDNIVEVNKMPENVFFEKMRKPLIV